MSHNVMQVRYRAAVFASWTWHVRRCVFHLLLLGLVWCFTGSVARGQPGHPRMEPTLQGAQLGKWWRDPGIAQRLGITPDQRKKIDEIFDQNRLSLIDLTAALDKEEAVLEPLIEAEQPEVATIRSQIDRIVQARSELEKANASMLLGIRLVLTQNQWKNLQEARPRPRAKAGDRSRADAPPVDRGPTPRKSH